MSSPHHAPVRLERVVALVEPPLLAARDCAADRDGSGAPVFVDATLGLGGHSAAVLERCPHASLVGIDRDAAALELAEPRLARFAGRTTLVHAVYDDIAAVLADLGHDRVEAVLFDLGVSSMQLDVRERGFAYAEDAPLDMRMDAGASQTAAEVLNTYPVERLSWVLRTYGQERFARRIAERVVAERDRRPFDRSARLVEVIRAAVPAPARRRGGHPAKRTFQALRIEVNDELGVLRRAIPAAIGMLAVGGRLVVMSYHSLEDRLVKQAFAPRVQSDVPDDLPFVPPGHEPELRLLTRGAERASDSEVEQNPRAAPVRLRAVERVRPSTGAVA